MTKRKKITLCAACPYWVNVIIVCELATAREVCSNQILLHLSLWPPLSHEAAQADLCIQIQGL